MDLTLDVSTVKTLLRLGTGLLFLCCAVVAYLITNLIGNKTLSLMFHKLTVFFVFFFIFRLIGTYFDSLLEYDIGVFSLISTYAFNILLLYFLLNLYFKLKSDESEVEITDGGVIKNPRFIDKTRVSEILDEMFFELRVNIKKTNEMKALAESLTEKK